MTIKEANRLSIMKQVDKKLLNIRKAAEELGTSLRQAKRIWKRYRSEEELGLISRHRGKISPNRIDPKLKEVNRHKRYNLRLRFFNFGSAIEGGGPGLCVFILSLNF